MKNSILIILLISFLISCTSIRSGKIENNTYIDFDYPIQINFPDFQEIFVRYADSNFRVASGGTISRPVYKLLAFPKNTTFKEFIKSQESGRISHELYWEYQELTRVDRIIQNLLAKLIYFTSKTAITISGPGSYDVKHAKRYGINAYLELEDYYIVLEYITYAKFFDEEEFINVLRSVEFKLPVITENNR